MSEVEIIPNWLSVLEQRRRRMLTEGIRPRAIGGFTGGAKTAITYFETHNIKPGDSVPNNMTAEMVASQRGPRGHAVARAAEALLEEALQTPVSDEEVKRAQAQLKAEKAEAEAESARAAVTGAGTGHQQGTDRVPGQSSKNDSGRGETAQNDQEQKEEDEMNKDQQDQEYEDEELEEGEENENDSAQDQDDIAPSRRRTRPRSTVQSVQPVIMMQAMKQPRAKQPQQPPRNRLLKPQSKIRVYKRGEGGRRVLLSDYTTEEIGGSLQKFLKEYVDPDYGEPSGVTRYEVVEVDDRDMERGAPASYTIESVQQQSNAPMDQLRDAVGLIAELREMEEVKASKNAELLTAAKKQALGNGDMSQMMMLLMMERMMGPRESGTEQVVLKMFEKMGLGGVSVQPAPVSQPLPFTMPMPPFQPLPPMPQPPSTLDKLVEVAVAKLANPPSLAEQLREFALLKELFGGGAGGNVEMLTAIKALAIQAQQPREVSSMDAAVTTFEKLQNVVKVLSPQMNMGGLTGVLQGILTPKLTEVLGNTLADGLGKATGALPGTATGQPAAQSQTGQSQPQAPAIPVEVRARLAALTIAQTRPAQVDATVSLIQTMWMSPVYKPALEPVLAALLQGNVGAGQQVVAAILQDSRPQLATADFVNEVLRTMAQRAGMPVPEALKVPAPRVTDNVPGLIETPNAKVIPIREESVNVQSNVQATQVPPTSNGAATPVAPSTPASKLPPEESPMPVG